MPDAPVPTLSTARTAAEVLEAVARWCWWEERGAECPGKCIPTPERLAAWVAESVAETAQTEAAELLTALVPPDWRDAGAEAGTTITTTDLLAGGAKGPPRVTLVPDRVDMARGQRYLLVAGLSARSMATDAPALYADLVEQAHRLWRDAGGRHPLAPLVVNWQEYAPMPAPWDERQHTNLPAPLAQTRYVVPARELRDGQAALPFDFDALQAVAPPDQPRFEVGYLPTLKPAPSLLPLALLDVFSSAASRGRGGPVPVPARIGWEVLVALGGNDRERIGGPALLDCTLIDLFSMVYPATPRWQNAKGDTLLRGLFNLDAARVRWRGDAGGGLYPLVEVYRLPTSARPGEPLAFLSHLPPGSRQGPQVDRMVLRILAAKSARLHRMMLVAYCLYDRYGTVNGRLIAPTRPVVDRHAAGYIVDTRGKVVTERGVPTRRATHRRAVQTGERERNPETDRYPWLEGRDLILTSYRTVADTAAARRDQRRHVHEDATALRDAGRLDFEEEYRTPRHGGPRELVALRLLPSAAHVETHAARWAARKHGSR